MEVEVPLSRKRLGAAVVGTLGFAAIGLWMITEGGAVTIIGWIVLAVCAVGIMMGMVGVVNPRIVVRMDESGVTLGKVKQYPWSRIVEVPVNANIGTKAASLRMRDAKDVVLPTAVPGGPDRLAEQIRSHPAYRGDQ